MAKIGMCLIGYLLFVGTAHAGEAFRDSKEFNVAEAFRNCSLAQKGIRRTLTDANKQAARWCVGLGMAYENGDQVDESGKAIPINYTLATQYYGIGCNLTVAYGCVSIAQMMENGKATVPRGKDARLGALGWYSRGCFAEDKDTPNVALSCSMGGTLAMTIALEKKDRHAMVKWLKTSVALDERACQLGSDISCRALVTIEQALSSPRGTGRESIPPSSH